MNYKPRSKRFAAAHFRRVGDAFRLYRKTKLKYALRRMWLHFKLGLRWTFGWWPKHD